MVKFVEDESLSAYAQEIWWFDPNQSRIVNSSIKDNKTAQICHGPFKKVVNNVIVEQGFSIWEQKMVAGKLLDLKMS